MPRRRRKKKSFEARYENPVPSGLFENEEIWKFLSEWRLGDKTGWDLVDEIRKELKKEGVIDASVDRHIRAIKAYWMNLPVRMKRKGSDVLWAHSLFIEWLNHELIQGKSLLADIISKEPYAGYSLRTGFKTLDEVFEYLRDSGLIEIVGTDEKGRVVWHLTEYVQIVMRNGMFYVYVSG